MIDLDDGTTLFSDLDEIEASLPYIEDWKRVIIELRAAREVVAYFREWNGHSDECDRTPCDCGYVTDLEVLKKYDEARRG
jgi:hypothetical protein